MKEFKKDNLQIKIYDTRPVMGEKAAIEAAEYIKQLLSKKESINIVFAAAPSQNEFLVALLNLDVEWEKINAFHMDEYIGLDIAAPQGFGNFLKGKIFSKAPFRSINYLDGQNKDSKAACDSYTILLKENPIDVVFMGIGENGHIAFNDPHVAFFDDKDMVKVVDLDEKCRQQQVNDGCFSSIDKVPTHALTLTIPALMSADRIFCIVPAKTKAEAVKNTVEGEITEDCPASVLRRHKNATLYVDADSASLLSQT